MICYINQIYCLFKKESFFHHFLKFESKELQGLYLAKTNLKGFYNKV
jgi:hypothetical protein